ncbi:class I adenylate-forming enzyme family protein [Rhodococcoides kroppenstedtii]|uniref:class I adenylate-forming enzyme family protein n=1 Tax=Rhodococcoides kroppenstedtii TaxID=293050 RepID=UPI0028E26C4C|nr:AMP-binding protein [Rhodococcus kroppenstedtii]
MLMEGTAVPPRPTWPAGAGEQWSGCRRSPLIELVRHAAEENPHHVPLVFDDGTEVTNAEIVARTGQLAGFLADYVNVGDRVALAVGNRVEFVTAYLAVVANRGAVVMLSPELGAHEADFALADSGCRIAIVDGPAVAVFEQAATRVDHPVQVFSVEGQEKHGFDHLTDHSAALDLTQIPAELDDLIDIGYTSGTTGLPKALGGTHLGLLRYLDVHLRFGGSGPETRTLYPLQFHYGDPLTGLFAAIVGGATAIVMRQFSASRFWATARDTGATSIFTIGSIPDMLLSCNPSDADRDHVVTSAIAIAIPSSRHRDLQDRFGFAWREVYGSSETGPAIAMPAEFADFYVGTGALGIPYPEVEARLVTEDGTVVDGPGVGELQVSGEHQFTGYLNNAEATTEVMDRGWLRTGDVLRRDELGVYYFEGRRKELIRRSGVNIAPAEIEAVLRLHPTVQDAAAVPVADAMMGEEVKVYVELVDGAEWNPAALHEHCAERLSKRKLPRYFEHRIEAFPRTETQRIPKKQLQVEGSHRTDTAWDSSAGR